jgi:glucokinase
MKYFIGVDFGELEISVGITDKYGKLLRRSSVPTMMGRKNEELFHDIVRLTLQVIEEEGVSLGDVKSMGVGCPGIVNNTLGVIVRNFSMGFKNLSVRAAIKTHLPIPIHLENDSNCIALAESIAGAAEDISSSITLQIGSGIGAGIIIDNQIYSGFNNAGAEPGHMVIERHGLICPCGREGCWETYSSAKSLIRQTYEAAIKNPSSILTDMMQGDIAKITPLTVFEAAQEGDSVAKTVVSQYIDYLADGVTNLINIVMPEVVIIAGEIRKAGKGLFVPLRDEVSKRVYSRDIALPEFKPAETGRVGIVIGAAMLGQTHR